MKTPTPTQTDPTIHKWYLMPGKSGKMTTVSNSQRAIDAMDEQDAAYIVQCVNAHKDLVRTLANALHELRGVNANPFIIKQCEQAIAAAGGK